jgi:hypothetical protein
MSPSQQKRSIGVTILGIILSIIELLYIRKSNVKSYFGKNALHHN